VPCETGAPVSRSVFRRCFECTEEHLGWEELWISFIIGRAAIPPSLESDGTLAADLWGHLYRSRIHHPPWQVQAADVSVLDENLLAAARITRPDVPPLAHYARQQDVEVLTTERVA
jgi:hypothetical protein